MEISPRKPSKRAQEPVDEWLQGEGYFRKHAPRDPTCLFRAVSEQVYMTQHYHIRVRKECVEFMRKMKHLFTENVTIPFDDYLEQMTCFTEWGGMNEIQAMSLLYKREFVIFNGQKQFQCTITNNGFKNAVYLCHTPQKQYESIYTQDFIANAAYCQSIVYQILYENVFNMPNIESVVHKMLHDRTTTFRHDRFFLKGNLEIRDQLAAEMYNKAENGNDEVDDAQAVVKNIPPFPYRVAKALDPNIYRNTDFDIWHEIRREVKNAGWTRHNSHELQVGGKCLVQMNYNEEEFDKANNNSVCVSSLEKDSTENESKVMHKKGKQDPVFFYGHIQEMNKNQGPVLVFIEELGEKKIVPYSALKPLPLRKNKQNNWLPVCKKNVCLDSSQKWKKTYGTTSRKIKESSAIISSTDSDKNENTDSKSNFQLSQWKEEPVKMNQQMYNSYTLEKCHNYPANNSADMFPSEMILDNSQSSGTEIFRQENSKERREKSSFSNKNSENHFLKGSKSNGTMNGDNSGTFNLYSKQRNQKDPYYPIYSGEHVSGSHMDHMLRSINCSVQKSVDVNGSDLPLSDPFTLRFFYNLGLEYFRGNNNWNYLTNGQSSGFGQWYQEMPPSEAEIINITNGVMQDCTLSEPKKEINNDQKSVATPTLCVDNTEKCVNDVNDMHIQNSEILKGEEAKNLLHPPHEKIKEEESITKDISSRLPRTGLGPRFKKHTDNRHRNVQQHSQSNNHQHSQSGSSIKLSRTQDIKGDCQRLQSIPQQIAAPSGTIIPYQGPCIQQGMYTGLSYYPNETETFGNPYYSTNPGYFPVPCLQHSDIPDNNNVQPFSPHLCPGVDYAQAYSGLCPPYMCSQPPPYNMPPQNMQEHWYAVAGQPHYMQYAPILSVGAETACNGSGQNTTQNALS